MTAVFWVTAAILLVWFLVWAVRDEHERHERDWPPIPPSEHSDELFDVEKEGL